ncbi:hypothetical protein AKJ52_02745 [candidate division MSBL1 archaeon SCGC-AAA382C18]|uniref:HEPN domain-containing protein n=1 Tax=candidate division MSBL1 archaeon SCGC-AAA382C18 TaxID=1698281 RepID=A0A133VHR4_9EURY|nr:hypothetical protein AKJ52_02745 [candidate division MSBL1 archaeon SCGC-AAA382C18]
MAKTTIDNHLRKAKQLADQGESKYSKAQEIDEEFEVRKKSAEGCEDAFHSLVEFSESILKQHGVKTESHEERKQKLRDIGRKDLARLYGEAKDSLHTACYYEQQTKPYQKDIIETIKREIEKET